MPALATINTNTSADSETSSVTSINANARIDYILKFSKQLVVVVDDNNQGFAGIPGQFLSSLSEQSNSALVSVSSKLNDVQVRSRIIEQLYPTAHFDSEQTLTQSIVNFYGNSNEHLAIVVEQAHHLSLQIIHELCLLAEIAKKTDKHIDVVLFGDVATGKIIADNQLLFDKKLSIISAQTGQLISANADIFKTKQGVFSFAPSAKFLMVIALLVAVTAVVLFSLYKRDVMGFSQLQSTELEVSATDTPDTFVDSNPGNTKSIKSDIASAKLAALDQASTQDVLNALLNGSEVATVIEPATHKDILSAIVNEQPRLQSETEQPAENLMLKDQADVMSSDVKAESQIALEATHLHALALNTLTQGFVIQYAALATKESDPEVVASNFAEQFQLSDYKYYQRYMNGQVYTVITSHVFSEKSDAVSALQQLPEPLQATGIWIKSVTSILNEQTIDEK